MLAKKRTISKGKLAEWAFVAAIFIGGALLFIKFFDGIPLEQKNGLVAIDIKGFHKGLAINLPYRVHDGMRIAPWSVLPILPLGFFSWKVAWAMLAYLTTLMLIISVPRIRNKPLYWLSVFLVTLSFPSLRHAIDGNAEALMLAGILLVVYGYRKQQPLPLAAGILLSMAKPQESVLLLAALGLYMLQTLPRPVWIRTGALMAIVITPLMVIRGEAWLKAVTGISQRGSIMDMSLMAALRRADLFPSFINWLLWGAVIVAMAYVVWVSRRTFTREKAGMLVAASLLIAPYSAGNSILVVLAIGIIPLFQKRLLLGGLLIALINAQIFINTPKHVDINAYCSTALLLLLWGVLTWHVWQTEIRKSPPLAEDEVLGDELETSYPNPN